jgi:hypothetical protein
MPMPIDLLVEYTWWNNGKFYVPLRMMNYEKANPNPAVKRTVLWLTWRILTMISQLLKQGLLKKITIDPSGLMADVKTRE